MTLGVRAQETDSEEIVVTGEGRATLGDDPAAAEESAIWEAKRHAIEQAAGVFMKSRTIGRDFTIEDDEIQARSSGFIRRWEVLPGTRLIERVGNGKILRISVQATVGLLPVLKRLRDMQDAYNDLERPRVRIEISGDSAARNAQSVLIAAFQKEGFEVATSGPAEVAVSGRLETVPTVRYGDPNAPFGVGESVAMCRAKLSLQVLSTVSEDALLTLNAEADGRSFTNDAEARMEAIEESAQTVLAQNDNRLFMTLLARWVRERQEGHVVAVEMTGLDTRRRALLRRQLAEMRGFRKFTSDTNVGKKAIVKFQTRLATREIRRRLTEMRLNTTRLTVKNSRGPVILCAVSARPRTTRR